MGVTSPPSPRLAAPPASQVEQAAIRAVAYADVFDYPLHAVEVHRYLHGTAATLEATEAALARCSAPGGALSHRDSCYTLRGRESLVAVRHRRAAIASRLWPAALTYARVIAGLPFVRMVAVTGSLAWNNVGDEGDIDYLIVTKPGRLWVCRWLIAALRRAALLDGVRLCPNYLITTRALAFVDRSLYTAYEAARMTPITGLGMYRRLRGGSGARLGRLLAAARAWGAVRWALQRRPGARPAVRAAGRAGSRASGGRNRHIPRHDHAVPGTGVPDHRAFGRDQSTVPLLRPAAHSPRRQRPAVIG